MDLFATTDQQEIIASAFYFLSREMPPERMPKQTSTGVSRTEWARLADMGWFGLGLPEHVGGLGLSIVEEALVMREFGRHLIPPAAMATVLAGHLAAGAGEARLIE